MRVICLIDNLGSGGAQRQIVNLAILLKQVGVDVALLTYGCDRFFAPALHKNDIVYTCVASSGKAGRIINVLKALHKSKADAVISFLEVPGFIACLDKMFHPYRITITSERSAKEETFTAWRNRVFNMFERVSNYKVCNSKNAEQMWIQHYPQYRDKLRVIYNPVCLGEGLGEYSVRSNGITHFVVAASYQFLKNMKGAIEALSLLPEHVRNRCCIDWYGRCEVTSGNTEAYQQACEMIKHCGLSGNIILHEATDQIYEIMHKADVIALFSTVEGLPNAVCEGMMLGKPIIMSRVSDYQTLVNGNGYTFDPLSSVSIAEILEKVIGLSDSQLIEMGKESLRMAKELFSPTSIVQQWMTLLAQKEPAE